LRWANSGPNRWMNKTSSPGERGPDRWDRAAVSFIGTPSKDGDKGLQNLFT